MWGTVLGMCCYCSVAKSCPTLCKPMHCSMPGFAALHCLPDIVQTHVHWVGDAIQPSHPLPPPSPPALNLSQHQGLFQLVDSSHQVVKVLEFQHQSFPMNIQGWFPLGLIDLMSLLAKGLSRVFSSTIIESLNSLVLSLLYAPTFTSVPGYWENHSFDYLALCWHSDVFDF